MERGDESSLNELRKLEEILEKEPASYCFPKLSELHRRIGQLDEAITVAQRGIAIHPDYIGGYFALGRACHDKGLKKECREALERVVRATPENIVAQRILACIYKEMGDISKEVATYKTLLYLDPADRETKAALDAVEKLLRTAEVGEDSLVSSVVDEGNTELDDGLLVLEELEIVDDMEVVSDAEEMHSSVVETMVEPTEHFSTATLAELYISQGFPKRALKVYRDLLEQTPDNVELREKIMQLKLSIDEDQEVARAAALDILSADQTSEEFDIADALASKPVDSTEVAMVKDAVDILEEWLLNIGRIRHGVS